MSDTETPVTELINAYARLRGMLLDSEAAAEAVHQLAEAACTTVESAVGAGASLIAETGERSSAGTTDKIAAAADELQYQLGEGPCISAWASGVPQRVDDTAVEARWSQWCRAAHRLGVRSVLSVPVTFHGEALGALKVYSTAADAFSADDEHRLSLLAGAAATLLGMVRGPEAPQQMSAELRSALEDRQAIDTATGILMERHRLDRDAARQRLLADTREARLPLAELARRMAGETTR